MAPGAGVNVAVGSVLDSGGSAVALGSTVRPGDELGPRVGLGSVGLAAPEHPALKTPSTTMLATATPVRTLITGAVCPNHSAILRASPPQSPAAVWSAEHVGYGFEIGGAFVLEVVGWVGLVGAVEDA